MNISLPIGVAASEEAIKLQFRRFEFKYILQKDLADCLIPQLLKYMALDEYANDEEYYEVHSLYFDTPRLKNYYEKIHGVLNRKKPRIRLYHKELEKNTNVFFEIKRRSGEIILKDRAITSVEDLQNFPNNPCFLLQDDQRDQAFFNEFIFDHYHLGMMPMVLVSYKRKPFFSKFTRNFRVTFDYDMHAAKPKGIDFMADYISFSPEKVIMEVKFNGKMPLWFSEIIEMYGLEKVSFSKYCGAIQCCYNLSE